MSSMGNNGPSGANPRQTGKQENKRIPHIKGSEQLYQAPSPAMTTPTSPVAPNISRLRTDSLGSLSLRGPPPNTPDTQSLINGFHHVDLDEVNQEIGKEADIRVGEPTLVPENTPFGSPPGSAYRNQPDYLPRIAEVLEPLLERSPTRIPSAGSHVSPVFDMDESLHHVPTSPSPAPPGRGVREHSDWSDDIEGDLERDLARLANLAQDDFQRDSNKTVTEYYHERLACLLYKQETRMQLPRSESTVTLNAGEINGNAMVTTWAFNELKAQVEALAKKVEELEAAQKGDEKTE